MTAGGGLSASSTAFGPGPVTVIGQWLQAILLGQRDRRDQLAASMPRPMSQVGDDLAVAEAACELAVRQYFRSDDDVRAVPSFARLLREASGEDLGGGQMQTEAVIRAALGEPGADTGDISSASRFRIHTVAVTAVGRSLRLDEQAIAALLTSAETDVLIQGRMPSLVGGQADASQAQALAETYRLAEMWTEALDAYNMAIREHPDQARAISGRGMAHQALGQLEAAVADYSRALELEPDHPWIIASRANAYRLSGQYDLALTDYDCAIALDPTADWVLAGRAETFLLTGRYREALADFSAAIDLDPNDATHRLGRGETLEALGRQEEAQAEYRAAAELDPSLDIS